MPPLFAIIQFLRTLLRLLTHYAKRLAHAGGRLLRRFVARQFENIGLLVALALIVGVTAAIGHFYPEAGGLQPEVLQLLTLPALLLFSILHTAIWCFKNLLRPYWKFFKAQEPRLFADVLPKYEQLRGWSHDDKLINAQVNYYYHLFKIRCIRTVFSWLPLLVLLYLLYQFTVLSLTLVPR
jgi:hypothetical protein